MLQQGPAAWLTCTLHFPLNCTQGISDTRVTYGDMRSWQLNYTKCAVRRHASFWARKPCLTRMLGFLTMFTPKAEQHCLQQHCVQT